MKERVLDRFHLAAFRVKEEVVYSVLSGLIGGAVGLLFVFVFLR